GRAADGRSALGDQQSEARRRATQSGAHVHFDRGSQRGVSLNRPLESAALRRAGTPRTPRRLGVARRQPAGSIGSPSFDVMTTSVLPLSFAAGAARLDASQTGWTLLGPGLESGGFRTFTGQIAFDRAFTVPPVVQVGITGFDIDHRDNARLQVGIVGVDES